MVLRLQQIRKAQIASTLIVGVFVLACGPVVAGTAKSSAKSSGTISAINLRVEYAPEPLGIDTATPRFSWVLRANQRNQRSLSQSAYQILVASSLDKLKRDSGDLWDSGKAASGETIHHPYAGVALRSNADYWWKVRVWDHKGQVSFWSEPAHFGTAFLGTEGWTAKWIEASDSLTTGHNGYLSELAFSAEQTKWVSIDLLKPETVEIVKLYPAAPFDVEPSSPGYLFPVRFKIDVSLDAKFGRFETVVDQTLTDFPNPGSVPVELHFTPRTARYVRLFVTRLADAGDARFGFALAEMEVLKVMPAPPFAQLPLSRAGARPSASDSTEQGAWSLVNLNDNVQVSQAKKAGMAGSAVHFRKVIELKAPIKRARVFASALGVYEVRVNGSKLGENILAPEWTDYNTRVQYQTYDAGKLLKPGSNAISIIAADGWYAGRIAFLPGRRHYGDRPRATLQLIVEYADGKSDTFMTDQTWKVTTDGPIRSADLFDGETYDARLELNGWDTAAFDDALWTNAAEFAGKVPILVSQYNEPIQVMTTLKPIQIIEPSPGVYVLDMGQNMVGWLRVRVHGKPGTAVRMRHAEVLEPDGNIYTDNLRQNLQGASATDTFILRGSGTDEEYEPRFTFHGFRYVELTGLDYKPSLEDVVGRVIHSAVPDVGRVKTSSPMLNKLISNIRWTQIGNLTGVPTDCPQRSERAGWTADAQIISQTAIFTSDMGRFYTKWLQDIRDMQGVDGSLFPFAPSPVGKASHGSSVPGWSDATVFLAWTHYINYGDKEVLKQQLPSIKAYVDSVARANPDMIWRKGRSRGTEFGDWVNGDSVDLPNWSRVGAATPMDLFSTAMWFQSVQLASRMSTALGVSADAERYSNLAARIKAAFQREFVRQDGTLSAQGSPESALATGAGFPRTGNTQTAYALALNFSLLPPSLEEIATSKLVDNIRMTYKGHLSTGIHGTYRTMLELSERGQNDLAYQLVANREAPSWGYMLDHGATTIWERWDSYIDGRGYQAPYMNSFNHAAFGAIGEWIYRVVAGLNPDPENPGYRHFIIRPRPGGDLTWADATVETIRGKIRTAWKKTDARFTLEVSVPPNSTATVYIPASSLGSVTEGGLPVQRIAGVKASRTKNSDVIVELGSGDYHFDVAQ